MIRETIIGQFTTGQFTIRQLTIDPLTIVSFTLDKDYQLDIRKWAMNNWTNCPCQSFVCQLSVGQL